MVRRLRHLAMECQVKEMMQMATEAQLRAINKYNREQTISIAIRLNKKTDADIIDKLKSVDNKAGYIKALIRKDI